MQNLFAFSKRIKAIESCYKQRLKAPTRFAIVLMLGVILPACSSTDSKNNSSNSKEISLNCLAEGGERKRIYYNAPSSSVVVSDYYNTWKANAVVSPELIEFTVKSKPKYIADNTSYYTLDHRINRKTLEMQALQITFLNDENIGQTLWKYSCEKSLVNTEGNKI